MSKVTVYVGLDYHKDSIQVCVMDPAGKILANRSLRQPGRGPGPLVVALRRRRPRRGRGRARARPTWPTNWPPARLVINLAHPGYVARMKQTPDKTDWGDARVLADLVRVGYLPKVWLAPEDVRQLRTLTRYRQQLVDRRRAIKLRVTALLRDARVVEPRSRWSKAWMAWLADRRGAGQPKAAGSSTVTLGEHQRHRTLRSPRSEQRLAEVTADDPVVAQTARRSRGSGLVTAWTLRAEIGRFDRFTTGKQLARYCGLSPRNASSGQRQADAGLIQAGNPHVAGHDHRGGPSADPLRPALEGCWPRRCDRPASRRASIAAAVGNRWIRWLFHQVAGGPIT